jgi:hypothetical protein
MNANTCIEVVGWELHPGIPQEDYQDFTGLRMSPTEMNCTRIYGNFPPGLHLAKHGIRYVVRGEYGQIQRLERIG